MIARTMLVAILAFAPTIAAARCLKPGQNVSWYGEPQSLPDGSRYDPNGLTCAHRSLPFGTTLRLKDLDTGRHGECRINDRGPNASTGCELDVSRRVAEIMGFKERGVARALIEIVNPPKKARQALAEARQEVFEERWALTGLRWSKTAPATIFARMYP